MINLVRVINRTKALVKYECTRSYTTFGTNRRQDPTG